MRLGPVTPDGVLVGFGDYDFNPNSGTDVIAVSGTGVVTTLLPSFNTEQIGLSDPGGADLSGFRVLNGGFIWVAAVDPLMSTGASLATNYGGTWHTRAVNLPGVGVVEHLFDCAQEPNGDLYCCGSHTPDTAFVARSTDMGETWVEDLTVVTGRADGYNRFYALRRKGGKLAVVSAYRGGYYVRQADGSWLLISGYTAFDDNASWLMTYNGTTTVVVPGRGAIAAYPDTKTVSYSPVGDGSVWVSDGDALYLIPPPG